MVVEPPAGKRRVDPMKTSEETLFPFYHFEISSREKRLDLSKKERLLAVPQWSFGPSPFWLHALYLWSHFFDGVWMVVHFPF